ncbi:MAG: hypothetical protein NUV65_03770 [Candidatus Roizmanbacteria bacterium]|nr:hypothetical protein [Candidatus Roizmanbacteria bacterium]
MEKKLTIHKLSEKIHTLTEESSLYIPLPKSVEKSFRKLSELFLHNRIFFGKILQTSTVMSVLHYLPYQLVIGLTVALGASLAPLRALFAYRFAQKKINPADVYSQTYAFFPSSVHTVVYRNHIPIPFMPFQIDKKTIATSMQDTHFAKKALRTLSISGFRTMAWASNYLLGYQKKITTHRSVSQKQLQTLLITTTASVPGFNQGLKNTSFFRNALQKKYAEESFRENVKSIHFAKNNSSPIVRSVVVENTNNTLHMKIVQPKTTLSYLEKATTIGVIYPIALLTAKNATHAHWNDTPAKNISGFILAFDKKKPVCIALGSGSLIRIKVHELLPLIQTICEKEKVAFYCYVHTDDGGAVGDFYQENTVLKRYKPLYGHGISSLVGFTPLANYRKTQTALKNWASTKVQKHA